MKRNEIFNRILRERSRQDRMHPETELSPAQWAAVLAEETGEAVRELNAMEWGEEGHTNEMLVNELVQTAAVAVRILECCGTEEKI